MSFRRWYKLDNVGKFYSFTKKSKIPAVFRYSVTLTETIDSLILQDALNKIIEDFPNFFVHLRKGFFWYYLETTNKVRITEENLPICSKIYRDSDDILFRVSYYNSRINLEVSHILSDGRGSLMFFKALITKYLVLKYSLNNLKLEDTSSNYEKSEDSFDKYYTKDKAFKANTKKIFQYKGKKRKNITFMEYHISTKKVLDLAHSYNTSLTSLLISVLINSYKEEMKEIELNKTIKIEVPVDLRTYFNSETSKNFFGLAFVTYKFKTKEEAFEDIIRSVNKQLKFINKDNLKIRMNHMISFEKNIIARITPIFFKDLVLSLVDKISSTKSTSCLSNIGKIEIDQELEKYILNFNVLNTTSTLKMTVCSFKDDLSIGISSNYDNNNIIKSFCNFFRDNNITGMLNINWSDEDEM